MTADIFYDWFHECFVPCVRKHLLSRNIDAKGLLLIDNCPTHPPANSLVSNDGMFKVMFLPKNTTVLIQPLDQDIIHAFKVNYRRELLLNFLSADNDVTNFLKALTLKDVASKIGLHGKILRKKKFKTAGKNAAQRHLAIKTNRKPSTSRL